MKRGRQRLTGFRNSHKKISFKIIVLSCLLLSSAAVPQQEQAQTKYFELANGLKVFLYERHTLPLINISVAVNCGTKDESEETSGLVHILEHCILFRGTEFRSGREIGQDIRKHGAYFNAHTGIDVSLFEISLPSQDADFALKNQKEILFNLKLTQEEIDEEKKVILEELSQIQDDPIKYATYLVYQNLFPGHPYQKSVYGRKETIEAATVEKLEEFYRKFYTPSNCALAAVGDFKMEEMEKKVKEIFGELEGEKPAPLKYEKAPFLGKTVNIEHEMDVKQGYLVVAMSGPDFNHNDQYSLDVLTEVLGRGVNPMLNIPLRGTVVLVHSISMSYSAYKYGGAISIFITLDPKNINAAKRNVINFLKETATKNYSKDDYMGESQFYALDYLESAKNQIKFKIQRSQEEGLVLATSLAMLILLSEGQERGSYLDNIEKVTSSQLRKSAGRYLSRGRYVVVSIVPQKKNR